MRFKWENNITALSFSMSSEIGELIPYRDWEKHEYEFLPQLSVVQELIDNGEAEVFDYSVDIKVVSLLKIDEIDRILLGLPNIYPFMLYIEADGDLSDNNFFFKYGFYDFVPNGDNLFLRREGCILKNDHAEFLLTLNQYKVLETIDHFNALTEDDRFMEKNFTTFGEIKGLSKDVAILLDSYLENEDVVCPDKIKIDVSFQNEKFELKPEIEGVNNEELQKDFDYFPRIQPYYNTSDHYGNRKRVVVNNHQKDQLAKLKEKQTIYGQSEFDRIVENPEKYFDGDIIDLVDFSKRVREIGAYKAKFYPFVCPYESKWIPGFIAKDKVNGQEKIHFKTKEDLEEFIKERDWARNLGESSFKYKDLDIAVKDANDIILVAQKQFDNPKDPISIEKEGEEKVLIIKENADLLEYVEIAESLDFGQYKFDPVRNLAPSIELKVHQKDGIAWLQTLFKKKLPGGLLADDMGLGKTLQLLYFIEWHAQNNSSNKPYLIVAPVSLLENWQQEYEKFFKPQSLSIFQTRKYNIPRHFSKSVVEILQQKQLILTNYESLRNFQFNLCAVDYAIVVLDEAQRIKSPGTLVTNASKALKADFKVAMTGTPVENTLVDLWCIMDFTVPGLLGAAKRFSKKYQNPLKSEDTDVSILGENLRNEIGDFLKRRLKKDVAQDLPAKNIIRLPRKMPLIQFKRYLLEIQMTNEENRKGERVRNNILQSLHNIRDISDHPFILDSQVDNHESDSLISSSAKLQVVVETLREIRNRNEKVIIFTERRATQRMLKKVISDIFSIPGRRISIINGNTPTTPKYNANATLSRQQAINHFQLIKGFNVIIMSPLAAGVGLNVVGANHVIHYSRHWNPAKEDQATDRAYRIGQTKEVFVYYPMAVFPKSYVDEHGNRHESFDEVLDSLLSRKRKLASSTLFPTERSELIPDVVYNNVFKESKTGKNSKTPLTIEEIGKLKPKLFEAFVAALYFKKNYKVNLTPFSNDKGADVIAFKFTKNYLIQAKMSQSVLNNTSVQEIVTAKNYYERKFLEKFDLVVLTNSSFGTSAHTLGQSNNVKLIDRIQLKEMIQKFPVTLEDVLRHESSRLLNI